MRIAALMGGSAGIAIQEDRVFVAPGGRGGVWSRPLDPPGADGWPDLGEALEELKRERGARVLVGRVALLAPLVETRLLRLPRLRSEELLHVLQRDAERYFLSAGGWPHAIAVRRRRGRSSPAPVLAAAVAVDLLEAISRELRRAGVRVEAMVPAHFLWEAAVRRIAPRHARGRLRLLLAHGGRIEQADLEDGRIVGLRWHPADVAGSLRALRGPERPSDDAAASSPSVNGKPVPTPTVLVLGTEELPQDVVEALGVSGAQVENRPAAGALSASLVRGVRLPAFRSPEDGRRFEVSGRRAVRALSAVAAGLLILSGSLLLWGLERELLAVESRRSGLAPAVAEAFAAQESAVWLRSRTESLVELEAGAVPWAAFLAAVARDLPDGSHLLALEANRDSVVLVGLARDPAAVDSSLAASADLVRPRFLAPIRRQSGVDGQPLYRFRLAVSLGTDGLEGPSGRGPAGGQP